MDSDPGAQPRDERPFLILVSSLGAAFREYFLASIAPHYRVHLFLGGAGREPHVTWEAPYLVGHTEVDTLDSAAMIEAARALDRVDGVICYDEARVIAAAETAAALGLPTSPPAAVRACRDKLMTRRALAEAGVPQPLSSPVRSVQEALRAADDIGYPVVVKPRNMAASFGVTLAATPAELAAAYEVARGIDIPEEPVRYEDGVLIEEYLDGPEISVDSVCFGGRVVPLTIAHKRLGFEPYFEEVGHLVDHADPLFDDAGLLEVLTGAHAAIGFDTGMTHTELRRTAAGFKVVEVNARLGGDLIPYLGQLATGVDLSLAGAAVACGRVPDLERTRASVAEVRFYYPEHDMTVAEVLIDADALPPQVVHTVSMAHPGQEVLLPPRGNSFLSRLAAVVAVADSAEQCHAALEGAGKAVTPVPQDPGTPS